MQFFQPKVKEKEQDFLCKQHQQQIKFVVLDSQFSRDQSLLCKPCLRQNLTNSQIKDYQSLKQSFDRQQSERISQYEPIIKPHLTYVEVFQKMIDALKTRLIQQLDYLLWLSKDWANNLIDAITQYSFFGELDLLIQSQISVIDPTSFIQKIKKIHKDCNFKIRSKLNKFQLELEFKGWEELQKPLNNLVQKQEADIKLAPIQQEEYKRKDEIYEILFQVQDIDEQIYNEMLQLMRKEKISDVHGFQKKNSNQKKNQRINNV